MITPKEHLIMNNVKITLKYSSYIFFSHKKTIKEKDLPSKLKSTVLPKIFETSFSFNINLQKTPHYQISYRVLMTMFAMF